MACWSFEILASGSFQDDLDGIIVSSGYIYGFWRMGLDGICGTIRLMIFHYYHYE